MATLSTAPAPHAAILGIGAYRPARVVPNSEVVDAIDSSDEWIQQRSGIKQRRWAGPEETVQMMSVAAVRRSPSSAPASTPARSTASSSPPSPTCSRPRPSPPRSPTSSAPTTPRPSTSRPPAPASATASRWPSDMVRGGSARYVLVDRRRAALRHHRPHRPRHRVHLRRRRRRRRGRPERHPGHRPGRVGLRRRAVRPHPAARGLARRRRQSRDARQRCDAAPDDAGQPGLPLGVVRDGQGRPAGPRRAPASPSTSSTSSCRTRPTCASSTRWPAP